MRVSGLYFVLILFIVCDSCIDPYYISITSTESQVVISGQLTDQPGDHFVYLFRSSGSKQQPPAIGSAAVAIVTDKGDRYETTEVKSGKYQVVGLNAAVPGVGYSVEVVIRGTKYFSDFETLPNSIGSDSVYYEITQESFPSRDNKSIVHHLNVFSKTTLPIERKYFLRWDIEESYYFSLTDFPDPFNTPPPDCFAYDKVDPQHVNVLTSENAAGSAIDQQLATRDIDFTFKNRHYIIVRQLSTSEASYRYWSRAKELLNSSGSPFDKTPAVLVGNLHSSKGDDEVVLGYFEVVREKRSLFFLVPGWIPYWLPPYCDYSADKSKYPDVCLDCEALPNGTSVRPPWFD